MADSPYRRITETTIEVDVHAKSCLWFAWADDDYDGPYKEEGETYRPIAIPLSSIGSPEMVDIAVVATSAGRKWRHGPNDGQASTAEGRFNNEGNPIAETTKPAYKSDEFKSDGIIPKPLRLNLLTAMFGPPPQSPPPKDTITLEEVGLSLQAQPTGGHAYLYLGMHDGFEWDNNHDDAAGPIEVRISASPGLAGK